MIEKKEILEEMNNRSREVFRRVVEGYLTDGEPVGSRTLSREFSEDISAATIRNVMQDLELLGLLGSPHTSAGRIPTQLGLRMFVDGILEVSEVNNSDRKKIDKIISDETNQVEDILDDISTTLSGVTQGASLVLTPKHEAPIKHVEFLPLSASQALVVLVFADGHVENRLFKPPLGQTPSSMKEAANFLNAIMGGNTLSEAKKLIKNEIDYGRQELDSVDHDLVRSGLALWEDSEERNERLIVKGRANLLNESSQQEDLDRIKNLFDDLERKRDIADFLELTEKGEGVRIFIG